MLNHDRTFKLNRSAWQNYNVEGTETDRVAKKLKSRLQKQHRLGQSAGFEALAFNDNNFLVYGKLNVGSNEQEVNLAFDTGSDWLTIKGDSFDEKSSTTYENLNELDVSYRNYGGLSLHGNESKDKICLADKCIANYDFFLATSASQDKLPVDGVFGLSRDVNVGNIEAGPLMVKTFEAVGYIDDPIFTFELYTE